MGIISTRRVTRRALSCPVLAALKRGCVVFSIWVCCMCVCCAVRRFLPLCTSISTSFPPSSTSSRPLPHSPFRIPHSSTYCKVSRSSIVAVTLLANEQSRQSERQNGFCLPAQPLSQHLDGIKHRSPMSDAMQCHAICHVMSCRWMTRFYWTTFIFIT